MLGKWESGKVRNKQAHWLAVSPYATVVVRANGFQAEAEWSVSVYFGNMRDMLAGEDSRPVLFPLAELEAAKRAGLDHAVTTVAEILEEVKRCAA